MHHAALHSEDQIHAFGNSSEIDLELTPGDADGNFVIGRPDFEMMGLGLEGERLREILGGNFLHFVGREPRPVDTEKALALCADTREKLAAAAKLTDFEPDCRGLDAAEQIFHAF